MSLKEQVFNYCERGLDPSFWAEPLNALSNAAFLAAAVSGARRLGAIPPGERPGVGVLTVLGLLVALVAAIGIGSFLFHTYATRWALFADVGPITLFMLAYLAYALRAFLGLGWPAIGLVLPAFLLAGNAAGAIECAPAAAAGHPEPCLNGSLGYLPALAALLAVAVVCLQRRSPPARPLLVAGGVFLVSIAFRIVDRDLCGATELLGQSRGTHAIWHALNAVTLRLLLVAAIDDARARNAR